FARQLRRRGIALVVVPAPGKAMIHPEMLSPRYTGAQRALQNASFDAWKQALESEGVLVFDPAPFLQQRRIKTGRPQFLKTDTHWTPDAMQHVAERLGRFVTERTSLASDAPTNFQTRTEGVGNLGDIAGMLRLPEAQALFAPEAVEIRQVLDARGEAWRGDPSAEVLLLGDSFTNIYSLEAMRWGAGAGLAEQLSLALGRPIDVIAQNDAGAYATRQTLAQE